MIWITSFVNKKEISRKIQYMELHIVVIFGGVDLRLQEIVTCHKNPSIDAIYAVLIFVKNAIMINRGFHNVNIPVTINEKR